MSARLLDGKKLALSIREELREKILQRVKTGLRPPGLAVVLVGTDPASQIYIRNKREACQDVGIETHTYELPADTPQSELLYLIDNLNAESRVDGILVQLPLPAQMSPSSIIERIDPSKDVDGFHPYNMGRLAQRSPLLRPCTPKGIMHLLEAYHIDPKGYNAVIVGASNIVGRPMALELLLAGATVTVCHKFTKDLKFHVSGAEILIVAVGRPGLIPGEWIGDNSVIVDVGMNRLDDGRLVGDVDAATAMARASWVTPVPGGVGPMTVAMLLENTLQALTITENVRAGS